MSLPASKRRRLDNQNVLLKPFKSPMRTPSPEKEMRSTGSGDSDPKSTQAIEKTQDKQKTSNEPTSDQESSYIQKAPRFSLPVPSRNSKTTSSAQLDPTTKSQLSLLRREESHLSSQLSKLKSDLDRITQARTIESSNRDRELSSLITLWRSASQSAAEEVYSVMREKVNSLGGVRRWRKMERERKERFGGWEEEERQGGNGEEGEDEDGERGDGERAEDEEIEGLEAVEPEQENAEETFSMDVMLKYLGLTCDVIGYDCDAQRWVI